MAEAILKNNTTDTVWAYVGFGNNLLVCDITLYMRCQNKVEKLKYVPDGPIAKYDTIPPKNQITRPVMAMCMPENWSCPIESYICVIPQFTINQPPFIGKDEIKKLSLILEDTLFFGTYYKPKFYFLLDKNCTRFRNLTEDVDSMFNKRNENLNQL